MDNHVLNSMVCILQCFVSKTPPTVNFSNFSDGVCMYKFACSLHKLSFATLHQFAIDSTQSVSNDQHALYAMKYMNNVLKRYHDVHVHTTTTRHIPVVWKFNHMWDDIVGTRIGYRFLHNAYHVFDVMRMPSPPSRYVNKNTCCNVKQQIFADFDTEFKNYTKMVAKYIKSRHIIVQLRALMNIVHFGSFVDEGRRRKRMHRSALLESLNESQRVAKLKNNLIVEFENCSNGETKYTLHEDNWRDLQCHNKCILQT